ncbi:MAG: helix-turn-helix transcriptional regulator [Bacteroidales bacterium]|nr:helix-turn-helix transcriptional regulator [Bacteroidales bacterium]
MYACLTQEEMANLLNISKTKYLRKENGRAKFHRDEVIKIARILKRNENLFLTYWMADNIYEYMRQDKALVKDALDLLEEHLDDYENCVIMPNKSNSYSSNNERIIHRVYK